MFPGKNHPLDSLQIPFPRTPFPYRDHIFGDEYAHPSAEPRAPSSLPPFHNKSSSHKTLFHMQFRGSGFALLGTPPWLPLSYKPLRAAAGSMLWWILLDTCHTHSGSTVCRDLWSVKRDLSRCRYSLGASRFCRSAKANISRKRYLRRQPCSSTSYAEIRRWKWFSIKGECLVELDYCWKRLRVVSNWLCAPRSTVRHLKIQNSPAYVSNANNPFCFEANQCKHLAPNANEFAGPP